MYVQRCVSTSGLIIALIILSCSSGQVKARSMGGVPSQSPGSVIGTTWFDQQQLGAMGRMIGWSLHGQPETLMVHFSWMYMPGPEFLFRQYRYTSWNAASGSFGPEVSLQSADDFAGYVGVDAAGDGRAVVGGHNRELSDWLYDCHFYWDSLPGAGNFTSSSQVPRSIAEYEGESGQEVIWPKFRYQEGVTDTVLHVLAWEATDPPAARALYYFRKVGGNASGVWDDPPYIVDTIHTPGYDVAADGNSKVALVWVANLPCAGDPCDTCSGFDCRTYPQNDNDLYYQISNNQGVTWQPRVNLTNNVDDEDGYRPYTDLSALVTSDNNLHIVWNARTWPAGGPYDLLRGQMLHWSENTPVIRAVHDFDWDQTTCDGGAWQLNASKMTLSECDGKLYVLFVQFNDVPNGVENDCAGSSNQGYPTGAANGDLYLTISSDNGATWDDARNLTDSRTPGCDSTGGIGGPCQSDHWPSMARFGTDYTGDFSGATIVVPAGSSDPGTFYLDVQYINDHSAGSVVENEGFWSQAEVLWFRLACVAPIVMAQFDITPDSVGYPNWTKHGQQYNQAAVIRNDGNGMLTYSITVQEDTGPPGWLTHSGFGGSVSSGLSNLDTGLIHINTGGIVDNPGTTVHLAGRLIFNSNAPTSPDTFAISFLVTDTLYTPVWDTISTTCLSLTVANTGNCGNQGTGKVNMDYVLSGDCDSSTMIYLYDGSPVIGYIKGLDTVVNYSIYGVMFTDEAGFVPSGAHSPTVDSGAYQRFHSGRFLTHDSLVALEKTWYAPLATDSCTFVIECLKLWVDRDTTIDSVRIGEAIDWDIPSDSSTNNGSGFDTSRVLIYQYGAEYNQDDSTECQDNDRRLGGMALLDRFVNGQRDTVPPYGAHTADNATYVHPNSGFTPGELYARMADSGFMVYQSVDPDSQFVDLHTLMVFDVGLQLEPGDTLEYYLVLTTVQNGSVVDLQEAVDAAHQWYCDYVSPVSCGCCNGDGRRGNVDDQSGPGGEVDVADLTYLVSFLFQGGQAPPCTEEGNVDGIVGVGGPLDVADLTFLVSFLFQGGAPPSPCP
ncbi:MAG: hypothetical protein AB1744_01920 [Candidatus Zixiibacteriota bacterium]